VTSSSLTVFVKSTTNSVFSVYSVTAILVGSLVWTSSTFWMISLITYLVVSSFLMAV
jgi:hypothetical protein